MTVRVLLPHYLSLPTIHYCVTSGRVDPIPFYVKHDLTGLGKSSQDVRVIESTVSQRRGLDSERQTKETEDQRRAREVRILLVNV